LAYIGVQPAEAYTSFAVQHFTTSATTSYTLDNSVANENEIALFINNVRQQPGSSYAYTASGTTLTLSAATTTSDTMYCVFIGKAVQTVTPASGSVTGAMMSYPLTNFSSTGIDDNATSTAVTLTSTGRMGLGNTSPEGAFHIKVSSDTADIKIESSGGSGKKWTIGSRTDGALQFYDSTGASEIMRLTSSGLHIGGTGSANALDDYEEGTWTPSFTSSGGGSATMGSSTDGLYVKVGNVVHVTANLEMGTNSLSSGVLRVSGLPFTPSGETGYRNATAFFSYTINVAPQPFAGTFKASEAYISVWQQGNNNTYQATDFNNSGRSVVSGFYFIL